MERCIHGLLCYLQADVSRSLHARVQKHEANQMKVPVAAECSIRALVGQQQRWAHLAGAQAAAVAMRGGYRSTCAAEHPRAPAATAVAPVCTGC